MLAQAFNAQVHDVALLEEHRRWLAIFLDTHAHAGWRAGGDDVTWLQGHELADVADQFGDTKNHGLGGASLHALAIHVQEHLEVLNIGHFVFGDHPRTDGAEGVATLALVPSTAALDLILALAHVVDGAIAGHIVERFFLRHITGVLANDDAQLDFPIGLDGAFGQHDVVVGALNRRGGLHEHNGFFGHGQVGLGSVVGVVQTDGNELAHMGHGATHAGLAFDQGQLVSFELGQFGQNFVRQLLGADVGHHTA